MFDFYVGSSFGINTKIIQANLIARVRAICDSYSDGTHSEAGVVDM